MDSEEFRKKYHQILKFLQENPGGFQVFEEPVEEMGVHPENFIDYECAFASYHIGNAQPGKILDVGSYRHFILGLLSSYEVTTVDVRPRKPLAKNEVLLTCDAKNLTMADASFDLVLSLCALEHFGLGRYGDEFDMEADQKAFREMIRVLKPGGFLVFTTTITQAQPSIAFNAHRIYNHYMLQAFCNGLTCVEEKFYSHQKRGFCRQEEVTDKLRGWDVYLGCWRK